MYVDLQQTFKVTAMQRHVKRNVLLLCIINFLVMLGFGAFNLLRPYLVLALKGVLTELPEEVASISASEAVVELGLMMSAFMATRSIMAAVSGYLGDVFGRKKLISLGLALYIAIGLLYAIIVNVDQLMVLRAIQGVASGMVWPLAQALIADSVSRDFRGRAISLYTMFSNVARIIGPMMGVLAYSITVNVLGFRDPLSAFRAPTVLISVFCFPALIASLAIIEVKSTSQTERKIEFSLSSYFREFKNLSRDVKRSLTVIYINGLANGIAMSIFMSIVMVYAIEYVVKDPAIIGGLMSLSAIAGLIAAYPGSWLSDKIGRKPVAIAAMIPSRAAIMFIPFIRDVNSLTLIFLVRMVSFNISMPVMRALQADIVPSEVRGRVFGLQQAFSNLGMLIGPLIGSYLYAYLKGVNVTPWLPGIAIPFIIGGTIGFITLILFALFVAEAKA